MYKNKSTNLRKTMFLVVLAILVSIAYQFIFVDMKYFEFAMFIRTPKLIGMIICAFCIGFGSIIFQSII